MKILAVDTDQSALDRLTAYLQCKYPNDDIGVFCDPLLAIQYGFNNEVNVIYTKCKLNLSNGKELAQLIQSRQKSRVQVYYMEGARDHPIYVAKSDNPKQKTELKEDENETV